MLDVYVLRGSCADAFFLMHMQGFGWPSPQEDNTKCMLKNLSSSLQTKCLEVGKRRLNVAADIFAVLSGFVSLQKPGTDEDCERKAQENQDMSMA